jgi:hypothetical protein
MEQAGKLEIASHGKDHGERLILHQRRGRNTCGAIKEKQRKSFVGLPSRFYFCEFRGEEFFNSHA